MSQARQAKMRYAITLCVTWGGLQAGLGRRHLHTRGAGVGSDCGACGCMVGGMEGMVGPAVYLESWCQHDNQAGRMGFLCGAQGPLTNAALVMLSFL